MKKILIHLGLMALATALLVGGAMLIIHFYTNHGDELVKVPEIEGMRIDKAVRILEEGGFDYAVTDTVYYDELPLRSIVDQDPGAGFEVKEGRKIYLVLNSLEMPDVEMPDLIGKTASYNQAVKILENRGLKVGKKIKKPIIQVKDPDSEPVLEQLYGGTERPIAPKTRIKRNSVIDLVVGTMIEQATDSTLMTEDPEALIEAMEEE